MTQLRLDESEASARTLDEQRSAAVTSLDTARLRLTELREDITNHISQYAELKVHSEELARDCKNFREAQGELTRHIDTLKSSNSDLTKQCDDIRTAKDGIKDAISAGNASLQLKVQRLENDNAGLAASKKIGDGLPS